MLKLIEDLGEELGTPRFTKVPSRVSLPAGASPSSRHSGRASTPPVSYDLYNSDSDLESSHDEEFGDKDRDRKKRGEDSRGETEVMGDTEASETETVGDSDTTTETEGSARGDSGRKGSNRKNEEEAWSEAKGILNASGGGGGGGGGGGAKILHQQQQASNNKGPPTPKRKMRHSSALVNGTAADNNSSSKASRDDAPGMSRSIEMHSSQMMQSGEESTSISERSSTDSVVEKYGNERQRCSRIEG